MFMILLPHVYLRTENTWSLMNILYIISLGNDPPIEHPNLRHSLISFFLSFYSIIFFI